MLISSFNVNVRQAGSAKGGHLSDETPRLHRLSLQPKPLAPKHRTHRRTQTAPAWVPRGNEWKRALAEVKREYLDRKYRHCSSHCRTLLEGAKTSRDAEVTHLIFLHFYAASALEMQLRNLHHSSSYRKELLAQVRDHYRRASILSESEHEVVGRLLRRLSSATPPMDSDSQSPRSSVSSQDSQLTRSNSPTLTAVSDEEEHRGIDGPKTPAAEPIVRPDSPTLGGFDDWSPRSALEPLDASKFNMPNAMETSFLLTPRQQPAPMPQPDPLKAVEQQLDEEQLIEQQIDHAVASRLHSLGTFSAALLALQHQIGGHLASLEAQDVASSDEKALPPLPVASNHELRDLDLQARIGRLRAVGWKRPRFDVQRYEALRESALADLMS